MVCHSTETIPVPWQARQEGIGPPCFSILEYTLLLNHYDECGKRETSLGYRRILLPYDFIYFIMDLYILLRVRIEDLRVYLGTTGTSKIGDTCW